MSLAKIQEAPEKSLILLVGPPGAGKSTFCYQVVLNGIAAERPRLSSYVHLHLVFHAFGFPYLAGERYRMALRMGGAKAGKEVGEHLMDVGMEGDEVIRRVIDFMNYCKVGKVTLGETIKMKEDCETFLFYESFGLEVGEPSCFFTTGFLNGLFSAVKNQHVREIKCIATGDQFCEWEMV